jgi:hypothetical protein
MLTLRYNGRIQPLVTSEVPVSTLGELIFSPRTASVHQLVPSPAEALPPVSCALLVSTLILNRNASFAAGEA